MNRHCWCLSLFVLMSSSSFASDAVFAEIEDVYLTVLAATVSVRDSADRVYAIAMDRSSDGRYLPLPDGLWKKLAARLKAKGIDPQQFVSVTDIAFGDGRSSALIHVPTRKPVWVYSISGITWRGEKQLRVKQSVHHGVSAGGGSTLLLEKNKWKWRIVERTNQWIE